MASDRITDGFTSLYQGMDGGQATNLLPRTQYALGGNVTARGGYAKSRPGFNQYALTFISEEDATLYKTGLFQGGEWYTPDNGDPQALISISGNIFRLILTGKNQAIVENLTPEGDPNVSFLGKAWFEQAEQYMFIQDGVDACFIFDGSTLRRSRPYAPYWEIPTGTCMAYGQGRVFVARGKNFEAGDIVGGPTNVYTFLEVRRFNDSFAVPVTSGNVLAMIFSAQLDTALGQGELEVHTEAGDIITVNVTTDRQAWTTNSIQQIGLRGAAATGDSALVNVNNDTWFRARDGIRSYVVAWRQFGTWGNTPQSREVSNILAYDTYDLLFYASAVWFDNRLLVTTSPQQRGKNVYFQGMVVLDFDLLSSVSGTTYPPAWDGLWTGVNISLLTRTFFGSQERCFAFSYDEKEGNGLWEISKDDDFDNGCCPISSYVETGSFNFNSLSPIKKLTFADLWFDQRQGGVGFNFMFKPEQFPFWQQWGYLLIPDDTQCFAIDPVRGCQVPVTNPKLYGSRLRIPEPDYQKDNPIGEYPLNFGYDFQFRLSWTGRARIKGFRVSAILQDEEITGGEQAVLLGPCPPLNPVNAFRLQTISSSDMVFVLRLSSISTYRFIVSDSGVDYTASVTPSITGAEPGDIIRLIFLMPATTHPTIQVVGGNFTTNLSPSGYAYQSLVTLSFDGDVWNIDRQSA